MLRVSHAFTAAKTPARPLQRSSRPAVCRATDPQRGAGSGALAFMASVLLSTAPANALPHEVCMTGSLVDDAVRSLKQAAKNGAQRSADAAPQTVDVPGSDVPAQAQSAIAIPTVSEILAPLAAEPSPGLGKGAIQELMEGEAAAEGVTETNIDTNVPSPPKPKATAFAPGARKGTNQVTGELAGLGSAIRDAKDKAADLIGRASAPDTVDVPGSDTPAQAQKSLSIPSVSDILAPLTNEPSPASGKGPIQQLREDKDGVVRSVNDATRSAGDTLKDNAGKAADATRSAGATLKNKAGKAADAVRSAGAKTNTKADVASDTVRSKLDDAADDVQSAAGDVKGRVGRAADDVQSAAGDVAEDAQAKVGGLGKSAKSAVRSAVGSVKSNLRSARERTQEAASQLDGATQGAGGAVRDAAQQTGSFWTKSGRQQFN